MEELKDTLQNFSLYIYDDYVSFYAVWYDGEGERHEESRDIEDEAVLQKLLSLTGGGRLVRRYISDPGMQILDGLLPENMTAVFEGADVLESKWFEYDMDSEAKEKLLSAVFEYCQTGILPE